MKIVFEKGLFNEKISLEITLKSLASREMAESEKDSDKQFSFIYFEKNNIKALIYQESRIKAKNVHLFKEKIRVLT